MVGGSRLCHDFVLQYLQKKKTKESKDEKDHRSDDRCGGDGGVEWM